MPTSTVRLSVAGPDFRKPARRNEDAVAAAKNPAAPLPGVVDERPALLPLFGVTSSCRFPLACSLLALLFTACGDDGGRGTPPGSDSGTPPVTGETGMLVGITEAHNRVRASTGGGLPALVWDNDLAAVAQAWSEGLAADGCGLMHSSGTGLGENLAWFGGTTGTAQAVVDGWSGEVSCYTFGAFMRGDMCVGCDRSGGCGHYTQVVWRDTERLGCGVALCPGGTAAVWTCNYDPPGNFVGQEPY